MTQGSLFEELPELSSTKQEVSHLSNQRFCDAIEEALIALGYQEATKSPSGAEYVKNAPYTDMYGGTRKAAFLIQHKSLGAIRVEAHRQEQSGSVDQKFPFFLESLRSSPEHNIAILLDGKGYKVQAFDWLKTTAKQDSDKNIMVFSEYADFIQYLAEN